MENPERDVTRLIEDLRAGREEAEEELFSRVYQELRTLAHAYMQRERGGHTLQTTALVHEAYMRLAGGNSPSWENHSHFLRAAAGAMRRILVDSARRRKAAKRGGGRAREVLDESALAIVDRSPVDLIAMDAALERLASLDSRLVRIVELRFFLGLTEEEAAKVLEVSSRTLQTDWRTAKAWLLEELGDKR